MVGRYASVFWGLVPGWYAGQDSTPSAEDIAARIDQITDREGFIVLSSITARSSR